MSLIRSSAIRDILPYLRRFARAMTGCQAEGDRYAAATLEAIIESEDLLVPNLPLKTALFRIMYDLKPAAQSDDEDGIVQKRLSSLGTTKRAALMLHAIEELAFEDIAQILKVPVPEVRQLVKAARKDIADQVAGHIMIIEDDTLIALDLQTIVTAQGHTVTGIARTRSAATDLSKIKTPDLILSDIQLADQSSGIDAVKDLLEIFGDIPVIFITAFPELLLTGKRSEPAFVIPKPFTEEQIQSAVAQAMFFASVDGILTTGQEPQVSSSA